MKLLIKLILGFGILIILAIGAVAITLVYIDPNDYKDTIASKVKEETGRDLRIDGNISLSYYPWLGLDVEGVSLSNASGFGDKPFLKTKVIKARAKLLPLLRKELEMDTLVLHGATVNLARNADGITNWDDLVKPQGEAQASDQGMPLAALVLGGIDIKDANIHWRDMQQGVEYKIADANIGTGELKLGDPINITADLNASASKPALSAAIQFKGTVAYEDGGDILILKPMLLEANVKGKEIPGGEALVKLSSEINVNLDNNTAQINALDLTAFNTQVKGKLEASEILSGKPEVSGEIDVNGKDLPQLFKIAEIEPLASQLAKMSDKTFDVSTSFNADMDRNDININKLDINILGNKINAEVVASNVSSDTPAAKGKLKASGPDFPTLIKIGSQFMGDGKQNIKSLSKQLASAQKPFEIETNFDIDLKAGTVDIPSLSINALGMTTAGNINGKQINSDTPAISGELKTSGKNLPLLISIATQFTAMGKEEIASLTKQLSSAPKTFSVEADFKSDSKSGAIEMPRLSIKALGMTTAGSLKARKIHSDTPAVSGEIKTKGPDLPLLMLIAGSLQAKDSPLPKLAKDLGKLKQKDFNVEMRFDVDTATGKIDLPSLNLSALGLKVNGNLKGDNIQKSSGNMKGKLNVTSKTPKPLLTALGQADLAQVLKSIDINTGINGNTSNLNLKPLSLEAVFSGKNIPNSPVKLTVQADSEINLDKEIFNLSGLQVTGLGLDVKGTIKATQFKTDPALSGQLAIAPFDLRQFLQTMNQDVPKTADPKVLKRFALTTAFSGTKDSLSLEGLKAELDETRLQGDINIKSISPLDLEFGLGVDKLNADRYLPPQTKGKKTKAATPETVAAGVATRIPVETLQAVKIKGDFVMGQFVISNAKLSDLELSIRADKGNIKLAPVAAKLYEGAYGGDIHLDATGKTPKLTMNTSLKGVEVEPLLNDVVGSASVKGAGNITLALSSTGADVNTLRNTLSGKGNILFEKGTLIGVDVRNVLHQVEIMIESKSFGDVNPGEKTEFDKLTATLDIHNGIIDNKDLLMLGPGFNVKGKGMLLNLRDETWKYLLVAKADETRVVQGEKTFNIGGHEVPIKCRGKLVEKDCKPDVGAIAETIVKKAVLDKVFEEIGVKKKESVPQQPTETTPEQQQTQPQEPAQDIKEKVIKDIFDKIF
jgi:uncharacterized protein involved in outer membrane biogenesis